MIARFVLITLFVVFGMSQPSMAADDTNAGTTIKIAVVDIQQLMGASKAAKSIQSQGKDLRNSYQKKISKIEKDLKELEEKLVSLPKDTSKEDFLKQREKFQKRLVEGQKEVVELNQKLDKAIGSALNKLRDEIVEIVSDMATDQKYDLIISRADVVIVSKSIDITGDVMSKLNKSVSSIKVRD
jgi:outer membrane protein